MPGQIPQSFVGPDGARNHHGSNVVDYRPVLRAALINLDRWVTEGIAPSPNLFPRLSDGTAVSAAAALAAFPRIPGAALPDPARLRRFPRVDLGPRAAEGIGAYPAKEGELYPVFVSAIDADGNEVAGLRLPDLTVPIATHTGWNPRHPETGGAGQIVEMVGSTFPFPVTAADRARTGDPRPSLAERYPSRDAYLDAVRAAAERLAADRSILPEDVATLVDNAALRYDTFAAAPAEVG